MNTLKDLIKSLEDFSIGHKQINSFLFGFDDIITTKDIIYPLMYVKINQNSSVDVQSTYKLSISLLELSKGDDSNSLDIINNMEMIGNDIVSYFLDDEFFSADERNISTSLLFNVQDDNLDGVKIDINFVSQKSLNPCLIPGYEPERTFSCNYTQPEGRYKSLEIPISLELENFDSNYEIQKVLIDTSIQKHITAMRTNSATSGSTLTELENGFSIHKPITSGVLDNYPRTKIFYENTYSNKSDILDTEEDYTLKFHYKVSEFQQGLVWRIGEYPNAHSGWFYFPDLEGDAEIPRNTFTGTNYNYITIYPFDCDEEYDFEITDIKLYWTNFNQIEDENGRFGYNEYKVIDEDGEVFECKSLISIPEPLPGLMISVDRLEISAPAPEGNNAMLTRIYYKPGDVYVNWGNYMYKRSSTGTNYFTTYNNYETPGTKTIDVYGSGLDGFHFLEGSNTILDFSWFNNPDLGTIDLLRLYSYYNGIFFGNVENFQLDFNGKSFYSYYFSKMNGDITKSTIIQAKYFRFYNVGGPYNNFHYTDYGIQMYGDVGTMLKGYSYGGNYSKSYFELYRAGTFTYQDRIDAPIKIDTRIMIMGYSTNQGYWAMRFPDELCQLIIDLDTWRVGTIPRIDIRYNTPLTGSPLYADFLTAKNNMVADGTVFVM